MASESLTQGRNYQRSREDDKSWQSAPSVSQEAIQWRGPKYCPQSPDQLPSSASHHTVNLTPVALCSHHSSGTTRLRTRGVESEGNKSHFFLSTIGFCHSCLATLSSTLRVNSGSERGWENIHPFQGAALLIKSFRFGRKAFKNLKNKDYFKTRLSLIWDEIYTDS